MKKRRTIVILLALLLVVKASPFLVAALLFSHGQHQVSTELDGATLKVVFRHDGEHSDHHHGHHSGTDKDSHSPGSPHDTLDGHSTNIDDHVASLSTAVATTTSLSGYALTKYQPEIS